VVGWVNVLGFLGEKLGLGVLNASRATGDRGGKMQEPWLDMMLNRLVRWSGVSIFRNRSRIRYGGGVIGKENVKHDGEQSEGLEGEKGRNR